MALSLVWLRRGPLVNSRRVRWPKIFLALAPIAQSAEAVDLKSIQCGFESHQGDFFSLFSGLTLSSFSTTCHSPSSNAEGVSPSHT